MERTSQKINSVKKEMEDLRNAKVEDTAEWEKLQNDIDATKKRIHELRLKAIELRNVQMPTQEYKEIQEHLQESQKQFDKLFAKQEKMQALGMTSGKGWESLQYDMELLGQAIEADKNDLKNLVEEGQAFSTQKGTEAYKAVIADMQTAREELKQLRAEEENLGASFDADKSAGIGKLAGELAQANAEMNVLEVKTQQVFTKIKQINRKGFKKLSDSAKKAATSIKKLFKNSNRTNKSFSNLTRTMKQMLLSMAVFQAMSKGLEALKSGLQKLAVYSKDYNASMSELMSSTSQLKNALAVAFQPILNVVIPILSKFIGYISDAANAVSRFFAILSGKSTYTKAIKQNKDYAASLDKVGSSADDAKGSLAGFDDLDVLQNNSTSGSGSSNGADGSGFAEEAVSGISDWAQEFKDAIDNGDWYGVGELVAEKLNEALAAIPWEGIHEKARQIGTGIALSINGFVENADWRLVGSTIGNGINTGIYFAAAFVDTLNFSAIGTAISDGLNGFLQTVDWSVLGYTIGESVKGILDIIYAALQELDWQSLGDAVYEFLAGIDWGGVLSGIIGSITALVTGIVISIIQIISNLGNDLYAAYFANGEQGIQGFCNGMRAMLDDINQWLYDNMIYPMIDAVASLLGLDTENTVFGNLGELTIQGYREGMLRILKNMPAWIKENMIDPLVNKVKSLLGIHGPSTVFMEIGKFIMLGLQGGVLSMVPLVLENFSNFTERILKIFKKLKKSVFEVINGMLAGAESMANGLINAINGMIDALNRLSFSIPDWVPDWGGKTFGLNLSTIGNISIPRLANGGITTGSTLANIGEAGREAVLPLENNTGWMDDLADKLAARMPSYGAPTQVIMELDGKEFARGELPYFNAETARVGLVLNPG